MLVGECGEFGVGGELLQHVRQAQRAIGEPHAKLNEIFHEVVTWKVRGYDQ